MTYAVGSTVRCYAQQCEVLAHDPEADTYELLSILRLPRSRRPVVGYVEQDHHYYNVPAAVIDKWERWPSGVVGLG
jgi:hypothetical protein